MSNTVEPDDTWAPLQEKAAAVMRAAHAPYSRFRVGAVLEASDGRTFAGCNVENASYPVTMCAERVALGAAVAAGAVTFERLFLCSDALEPIAPCGMCRQALAEFSADLRILSRGSGNGTAGWRLSELLPAGFHLDSDRSGGGVA